MHLYFPSALCNIITTIVINIPPFSVSLQWLKKLEKQKRRDNSPSIKPRGRLKFWIFFLNPATILDSVSIYISPVQSVRERLKKNQPSWNKETSPIHTGIPTWVWHMFMKMAWFFFFLSKGSLPPSSFSPSSFSFFSFSSQPSLLPSFFPSLGWFCPRIAHVGTFSHITICNARGKQTFQSLGIWQPSLPDRTANGKGRWAACTRYPSRAVMRSEYAFLARLPNWATNVSLAVGCHNLNTHKRKSQRYFDHEERGGQLHVLLKKGVWK